MLTTRWPVTKVGQTCSLKLHEIPPHKACVVVAVSSLSSSTFCASWSSSIFGTGFLLPLLCGDVFAADALEPNSPVESSKMIVPFREDVSGVMTTAAGVLGPDVLPPLSERPKPSPWGDVGSYAVACETGRVERV